jgi:membrane protease YdiL (CAAX protease family)
MSVPDAVSSDILRAPPRASRWGFWATCAWGVAILAATLAAQIGAIVVVLIVWAQIDSASVPTSSHAATSNAIVLSAVTLAALPVTLLIIGLATRFARVRFADYVALKPVDGAAIRLWLACTLAYLVMVDVLGYVSGRGLSVPFVMELYASARASGTMVLMLLAVVVAAPISEELLFRGFLLRGWAASRIGVAGAIALTSAIWAGLHVQYDLVTMGEIFGLGLLFGWLRVRTGSTLTTIGLHGIYSLGAVIQAAILAG